jgi:hypothetical protein
MPNGRCNMQFRERLLSTSTGLSPAPHSKELRLVPRSSGCGARLRSQRYARANPCRIWLGIDAQGSVHWVDSFSHANEPQSSTLFVFVARPRPMMRNSMCWPRKTSQRLGGHPAGLGIVILRDRGTSAFEVYRHPSKQHALL